MNPATLRNMTINELEALHGSYVSTPVPYIILQELVRRYSGGSVNAISTLEDELEEAQDARESAEADADELRCEVVDLERQVAELKQAQTVPDSWRLVEKPTCYQLAHGNGIVATLAGPDAEENAAVLARLLDRSSTAVPVAVPEGLVEKVLDIKQAAGAGSPEWRLIEAADEILEMLNAAPPAPAALPGGLHPAVVAFAKAMQHKLDVNKHKDGAGWDRDPEGRRAGWAGCSVDFLLSKLDEEAGELTGEFGIERDIEAIRNEAADVGNIAMMLADVSGALDYDDTPAPAVDEQRFIAVDVEPPPEGVAVIGYHDDWVHGNFNENGTRECHRYGDGTEWMNACWSNDGDCWVVDEQAPTHWRHFPSTARLRAQQQGGR